MPRIVIPVTGETGLLLLLFVELELIWNLEVNELRIILESRIFVIDLSDLMVVILIDGDKTMLQLKMMAINRFANRCIPRNRRFTA